MKRRLFPASAVSRYLQARQDDSSGVNAVVFPLNGVTHPASASPGTNTGPKDINVSRSKSEVGIIVGILVVFGIFLFLIFVVHRKRSDEDFDPLAWWRQPKKRDAPSEMIISDPMTSRAVVSDEASTLQDVYDEKLSESQETLVPEALNTQSKPSMMQRMKEALSGAMRPVTKEHTGVVDVEKGSDTDCAGLSQRGAADDWSRRPASPGGLSIQTASSAAIHPVITNSKLQKQSMLRPGLSAFSWSTCLPTPLPPSHASMRENPLPPLPWNKDLRNKDLRRDTTLTSMTGDSEPARHRSISSWVANMQTRQGKRRQGHEGLTEEEEIAYSEGLQAPPPVANAGARNNASNDANAIRMRSIVCSSSMSRSGSRSEGRPLAQDQLHGEGEDTQYAQRTGFSHGGSQGQPEQEWSQQPEYYAEQERGNLPGEEAAYANEGEYQQEHDKYQIQEEQVMYDAEGYQHDEQQDSEEYQAHEQTEEIPLIYEGEEQNEDYAKWYEGQVLEYDCTKQEPGQAQQPDDTPPHIHIHSSSDTMVIAEEDWIPNVTRYPSGTTAMSGHTEHQHRR